MKIIRATHLGMCFGVRDAIDLAKRTAHRTPVTVLGQLAHNQDVIADLENHGVVTFDTNSAPKTRTVMITAHGASDRRRQAIRDAGFGLVDATCPLVHQAHRELRMLLLAGYHPVIIGKRGHVEVIGMTEDMEDFHIVEGPADLDTLPELSKIGVVAQTTQPIERVERLVAMIRARFPNADVLFMDTVCRPTKDRQNAAMDLAKSANVVIVVGGSNSNNTHELVQSCRRFCDRVHHVENASQLNENWFTEHDVVGLTAGTSTPDSAIDAVEKHLSTLASDNRQGELSAVH